MNILTILEMQMLAEQITYLRNKDVNGSHIHLIEKATEAYIRLSNKIAEVESHDN